ncbi:MAG TPA: hypothetical protein DDW52_05915, partial [Planctomycetaceae bacterium]|nr:hypothetical protein [Planctomycetaceae bacterium]
ALGSYSQLEAIRREGIEAWAECREPLAARYRQIEQTVARKVDDEEIAIAWAEKFRLAADRFRTTAQPKEQLAAARNVEELLAEPAAESSTLAADAALQKAIDEYNAALADETQKLNTLGCRLLDIFLELPPPQPLELTEP